MSVLDNRNILVQQNIPKLIKSLTGFKTNDENYNTCIQFAYSHLKYHRFLTVNSHEIKREIDGICEKLRFSNFHDTEIRFRKMVEDSILHELAVTHYEKDVMYSILSFLTTLAYDPINHLKTKLLNQEDVFSWKPVASIAVPTKESNVFINSLLKDNFKLLKNETDSELSEWSDSNEEDVEKDPKTEEETGDEKQVATTRAILNISTLMPPEKPSVFKVVRIENSDKWLHENIQNSWWSDGVTSVEISSSHPTANFYNNWQKHLSDKSLGFIRPLPVSLISEYCLLREIFWMFSNPVDCKFFKFDKDGELSLRSNVTIPSTMPESLSIFLSDFVRSINIMHRLKTDCMKSYQSSSLTHTMESYYKNIQGILDEFIIEFILKEEETVSAQNESYTIIILFNKIRPHAKMLEMLWNIHETSVLDSSKFPPHICASYLLASLNLHTQISCTKEKKNLAVMLLMACLKTYLEIFEVWWTQARLDDLKLEFLMEISDAEGLEKIQPRLLEKSKEKLFYLNDSISKKITEDPIIKVMMSYSVKASFTLDVISKLNRINEMRQIVNNSTTLYDQFVDRIQGEISKFSPQKPKETINTETEAKPKDIAQKNRQLVEDIKAGMLSNGDELLLLAFKSTFDRLTGETSLEQTEASPLDSYKVLNNSSTFCLLPLEHSILRVINDLLSNKIAIAERFVMNIYFDEYHVQQNLQEIRKVFFLESNELANFFYVKLFPQMEAGEALWANPYLLTVALNDAICSSRQNSSTLFSVEVSRRFDQSSVLEAVDGLTLYSNVNNNLVNVFTPQSMQKYNEVFRFLLKIKWGQRILSCLRFPNFYRHRAPYAKLYLIDLVIKRLCLTRFAMQQTINSLHNHLIAILSGLSFQLDAKVAKSQNVSELISHHETFVAAFYEQAHLGPNSTNIYGFIIEMLKLVKVLKDEWNNITVFGSLDESGNIHDSISLEDLNNNTMQIEAAFGVCEYELRILFDS